MPVTLPKLKEVPPTIYDLNVKATYSGIVYLKTGRYTKRYVGSNGAQVDINGKFYATKKEYDKAVTVVDDKKKKKKKNPAKSPENLMPGVTLPNVSHEITEKPERKKGSYKINKVEVRNRIQMYNRTQKGKKELYFWTVTFPPVITDDLAYQAFNTWLTALRQKKMLKDYLWIAERQTGERLEGTEKKATNTVHFHIAIPHRMSVKEANRIMRTTLSTFIKNNMIGWSLHQCKRYNGVDIAKNRKTKRVTNFAIKKGIRSLGNYLSKYVTKNDAEFEHLAWHNSRGYSNLFIGVTFTVAEVQKNGFKDLLIKKSIFDNEYFMFFAWINGPPDKLMDHLTELNDYVQYTQSAN